MRKISYSLIVGLVAVHVFLAVKLREETSSARLPLRNIVFAGNIINAHGGSMLYSTTTTNFVFASNYFAHIYK